MKIEDMSDRVGYGSLHHGPKTHAHLPFHIYMIERDRYKGNKTFTIPSTCYIPFDKGCHPAVYVWTTYANLPLHPDSMKRLEIGKVQDRIVGSTRILRSRLTQYRNAYSDERGKTNHRCHNILTDAAHADQLVTLMVFDDHGCSLKNDHRKITLWDAYWMETADEGSLFLFESYIMGQLLPTVIPGVKR